LAQSITFKVEPIKSGGYMAYCPAMKPVIVQGKTEEEATTKLKSAVKLFLQRHPEFLDTLRSSTLE